MCVFSPEIIIRINFRFYYYITQNCVSLRENSMRLIEILYNKYSAHDMNKNDIIN